MGEEREDEGRGGEKGEGGNVMGEWKEGQGCQNLFLNYLLFLFTASQDWLCQCSREMYQ